MEEKKTAGQWCDEAVGYVRFRPDRSAIRRELEQHLMDSRFQLLDQGLGTEEADARSVAAMGDPRTVGLALDPEYGVADGTYRLLGEVDCPTPVLAGDYTLTVTTALYREETDTGQRSLTLGLTAQPRHFWMEEPALSSILMAVDSSGTVYSDALAPWISVWPLESDGGTYRFCVDFISVPGEPEWIQLQSRLDDSWSLRLELPEEVRP